MILDKKLEIDYVFVIIEGGSYFEFSMITYSGLGGGIDPFSHREVAGGG